MLFKTTIAGEPSGSIGGLTFSHNKGGQYIRARVVPTDPATVFQQINRAAVTLLANRWVNILTPAQRAAWDVYAANVPRPNALGDFRLISGLAHYTRSNVPRIQIDPVGTVFAIVDAAPTVFNVGDYGTVSAAATGPATTANLTFTVSDAWVSEDSAGMLTWWSRPQSLGKTFFKGPYRVGGPIPGDSALPPTSPQSLTLPFLIPTGTQLFGRVNVTRADGRLSDPTRIVAVVS